MMNLETTYLGLKLKNPLVPSASPLSRDLDTARRLEDAGAAALVMYSLFEEDVLAEEEQLTGLMDFQDLGHGEADTYLPLHPDYKTGLDEYLEQLQALKSSLDIPVVASLNGATESGWVEHGRELEQAGADALELNVYSLPAVEDSAEVVEGRYINILRQLKSHVQIPVTVKLSPYFTSLGYFVRQLETAGADGVVLFNRFYQPEMNLDTLDVEPQLHLSQPYESLLRMHWIARLYDKVGLSLAATGGIHGAQQVLKMLLAGASVAHVCAVLLQRGPEVIGEILQDMTQWMEEKEYESVNQLMGSACQVNAIDPEAWDRMNYIKTLRS
ncbi:MAG TPA: dihydroorotate dehydrogenase-like protein [Thiolapillus brandeum]|uniref:Dihydroorotate dehydrogenase-like protein n=1 Tax=Thiolapillus brandeum TaxID=1076588 RepID=A0A831WCU0_9GAMM|nr:dihydroorotate dehydrogenase-like protein [Thiolapillus brandeum]